MPNKQSLNQGGNGKIPNANRKPFHQPSNTKEERRKRIGLDYLSFMKGGVTGGVSHS
jgi:hypothetical protein